MSLQGRPSFATMGRLLDAEGRAVGYEQVDVWA